MTEHISTKITVAFVVMLFASGVAWGTSATNISKNDEAIVEVQFEQKALETRFDKIQHTVTKIETNQQNLKEDVLEIKGDIKLILKSLRGN